MTDVIAGLTTFEGALGALLIILAVGILVVTKGKIIKNKYALILLIILMACGGVLILNGIGWMEGISWIGTGGVAA